MLRRGFRKEIKHLGTAAAVVLAMFSPLTLTPSASSAATWASCATGISTPANADTTGSTATSCLIKFTGTNTWTVPDNVVSAAVAIVGGGGGGGWGALGGGGGAGEVLYTSDLRVTAGAAIPVALGAGGASGWSNNSATYAGGQRGGTTQFGSYYAGGGYGGAGSTDVGNTPSSVYGGSGGGSNMSNTGAYKTATAQSISNWSVFVNNAGSGYNSGGTNYGGGGGGGAGSAGSNATTSGGGNGGAGKVLPSPFGAYTVAGGGGGWGGTASTGGSGIGGDGSQAIGSQVAAANGTNLTGSGGGAGGRGGTGVVYVQYNIPRTVTFNANGGSGTMAQFAVADSVATALPANTFTRSGYTFKGWATSAAGEPGIRQASPSQATVSSPASCSARCRRSSGASARPRNTASTSRASSAANCGEPAQCARPSWQ